MNDIGLVAAAQDARVAQEEEPRRVPLLDRAAMRIALRLLLRAGHGAGRLRKDPGGSSAGAHVEPPRRELPAPLS